MERYLVYQFCLANYDDSKEFLSRIDRFLNSYQKGMGEFKEHYMFDIHFKEHEEKEILFIDIIPSIFSAVTHDFELLSKNDSRDLYPTIKEITERFENEFIEDEYSLLNAPTLVIKFKRLTKFVSKEIFKSLEVSAD